MLFRGTNTRSRSRTGPALMTLVLVILIAGCGGDDDNGPGPIATRSFYMGFSPFWASASQSFGDWRFDWSDNGDLVALHADDFFGVPWSEFAKADPGQRNLHAAWVAKWDDWFNRARGTGHPVLVSLSPLANRSRLAPEVDGTSGEPVPDWDTVVTDPVSGETACYAFDAAQKDIWADAYVQYVKWIIDTYAPEQVIFAIEANIQFYKCPSHKDGFIRFISDVHDALKAAGITQPVFVSFELEAMFGNGLSGSLSSCGATPIDTCFDLRLDEALAISGDAIGFSTYPQNWWPRNDSPPADRFDRVRSKTAKPIWISETGWNVAQLRLDYTDPAQCNDPLNIYFDVGNATQARQQQWMDELIATADRVGMAGIVWWLHRDYLDAATASTCPCDPTLNGDSADTCARTDLFRTLGAEFFYRAFGNMGLWTQDGTARPALSSWQAALARPRR